MSTPRILEFRLNERRLRALFDEPANDLEPLIGQITRELRMLHQRAPARAVDFAKGTLMLLDRALVDVAAEERGRA